MKLRTMAVLAIIAIVGITQPATAKPKKLPLETKTCNSIISSSFRLDNDLNCTGPGFQIGGSGIVIDLNGHTLKGDANLTDYGIWNHNTLITGGDDVTIKNGTIKTFGIGVMNEDDRDGLKLVNVTVVSSTTDNVVLTGDRHLVKNSTITYGFEDGLEVSGDNVEIIGNQITSSNAVGLRLNATSQGAIVKRNEIVGNATNGVTVAGDENTIVKNSISGNSRSAANPGLLMLATSEDNSVVKNRITGNGDDGYRDGGTGNDVTENVARGNGFQLGSDGIGTGIDASGATDPTGADNISNGNDATTQCVPASFCE